MGLVWERGAEGVGIEGITWGDVGWIGVKVHDFGEIVWTIGCKEK
jgi:hypothetical protein